MIIAIDGPAGSGKTTVAKRLAKRLNIFYLDTGATYRALTWKALKENVDLDDEDKLEGLAKDLKISFDFDKERVYLDDEDVTAEIRTPLVDRNISKVASKPKVRKILVELQRNLARCNDFVVEGRDTTTVVFPRADFKFYLDADFVVRAQRRFKELKERGISITFEDVKRDLEKRDRADLTRKVGPLKRAKDAIYIDSTELSIEEVVEKLYRIVSQSTTTSLLWKRKQ